MNKIRWKFKEINLGKTAFAQQSGLNLFVEQQDDVSQWHIRDDVQHLSEGKVRHIGNWDAALAIAETALDALLKHG